MFYSKLGVDSAPRLTLRSRLPRARHELQELLPCNNHHRHDDTSLTRVAKLLRWTHRAVDWTLEAKQLERCASQRLSNGPHQVRSRAAVLRSWTDEWRRNPLSLGSLHERAELLSPADVPQLTVIYCATRCTVFGAHSHKMSFPRPSLNKTKTRW